MKKSIIQIKDRLKELSEKELRQILVKLFESMNFLEVQENHGVHEFGKDIVFYEESKLHHTIWYACVVKIIDINQRDFEDVSRQINECFRKSYPSHTKGNIKINNVIVITSGVFKDNAKQQIADLIQYPQNIDKVSYWDCGDIAENVQHSEVCDILFNDNRDITQSIFNKDTLLVLNTDSSLKLLESDFNIKVDNIEDFRIKIKAKTREFENEREEYLKSADLVHKKMPVKFLPEINELLGNNRPVLLHGIAASGKTTIIKKIGKDFINQGIDGYVFFFEAFKFKKEIEKKKLPVLLQEVFKDITSSDLDFTLLNQKKRILLLIDGLDELYSNDDKSFIINHVLDLIKVSPFIKVVISSRNNDYLESTDLIKDSFDRYELLPLSLDEMIDIGSKLLESHDQQSSFIKLIRRNEIAKAFPKTPLTAILLAILFKENKIDLKELPRNLTELYSKFIDVFLNKWDKNKGVSEQFKYQERQFVIQKIAEHLHKKGEKTISLHDLEVFLSELYKSRPIQAIKNVDDFIENICQRCSIIVKDEKLDMYTFFHLTIQEYLTSTIIDTSDEATLLQNYYDDWWLNTNIFYAGKTPYHSTILEKVAEFKVNYPGDPENKLAFIIHTTKILQAAHLIDVKLRLKVLKAVIKIFDEMMRETIEEYITSQDPRINKRTMLELVLWSRNIFFEFLGTTQFLDQLKEIHSEIISLESTDLLDMTEYNLSYCIAVLQRDANPLYDFIISRKQINPRWYRIVDVDVKIKNLEISNRKLTAKFKSKALINKEYIKKQFKDKLIKHYQSLTGMK